MTITCTWNSKKHGQCQDAGTQPQRGTTVDVWATLCKKHEDELDRHLSSLDAKRILSAWIAAKGGPEKMCRK